MAQTFYLLMDMVTFADCVRDRGDILFLFLDCPLGRRTFEMTEKDKAESPAPNYLGETPITRKAFFDRKVRDSCLRRNDIMGPTGFDSKTNGDVSMPSAGIQLVNLMFHTFNWR